MVDGAVEPLISTTFRPKVNRLFIKDGRYSEVNLLYKDSFETLY